MPRPLGLIDRGLRLAVGPVRRPVTPSPPSPPPAAALLLTDTGDHLVTEQGDAIATESA
ncbi:MAG TPA: hypothetical protein VFG43_09870 [Geminicoccaceae bacterium]|nr:hypothetical protein [Geminicoccaceae bacterium]